MSLQKSSFVCLFSCTDTGLSNVEQMFHAARMMTEKELKNKQMRNKTVMTELATSRHDLKMALMKRGMSTSAGVDVLFAVENAYGAN